MKIRMKVSLASSENWSYAPGQVVDVSDEIAEAWIAADMAVPVVEDEREATVSVGDEVAVTRRGKKRR